jgi:hypothetical protein
LGINALNSKIYVIILKLQWRGKTSMNLAAIHFRAGMRCSAPQRFTFMGGGAWDSEWRLADDFSKHSFGKIPTLHKDDPKVRGTEFQHIIIAKTHTNERRSMHIINAAAI